MRQIAAEVGVQVGTLYLHTADKQALLCELMDAHLTDLLDALDKLPPAADPETALDQFTRFHIRFHAQRSDAVFISYMELRNLEPANFARVEALRRAYEQSLQKLLDWGRDEGRFDLPDTKLAAYALIAMLTGVTTWYREGGRLSLDRVEAIYGDMVRKSVGL